MVCSLPLKHGEVNKVKLIEQKLFLPSLFLPNFEGRGNNNSMMKLLEGGVKSISIVLHFSQTGAANTPPHIISPLIGYPSFLLF